MSEVKEEKTLGTEEQQEKVVQAESQEAKETDAKAPEAQQDNADKKEFAGKRRRRDKKRPIREEKEFMEEVLQIDRVTRVVKGGRRLRFRVTVIIGDKKGKVAIGIGKSAEVVGGIQKAIAKAKKSLIKVTIENGTIPHELRVKHKSAKILLMPGTPGGGIIAGGAVRKICELAGIENVIGKIFGTNNKIVNAQATIKALEKLSVPVKMDEVEKKRKKFVKKKRPARRPDFKKAPTDKKEMPKKEEK